MKKLFTLILLALFATSCGSNQGSTNVNNSESGSLPSITIGKLVNGQSLIQMPLDVFGTTDADAEGAVIDVEVNDVVRYYDLSASAFYRTDLQEVRFVLTSLINGDVLRFTVHKVTDQSDIYSGTVSGDVDSYAFNINGNLTALSDAEALSRGETALQDRDLNTAMQAYCNTLDNGSTDSGVAFGCFLAKSLVLPETSETDALLALFNEEPINVEADILEGIFDEYNTSSTSALVTSTPRKSHFLYSEHPDLPLHSILYDDDDSLGENFAQLVYELNTTGTTAAELQTQVDAYRDDFEYMEAALETALADASFSFTIPQELFNTDNDLNVSYNDVRLAQSGVKSTIVSLNIFAAYDWGITFSKVLNSTGTDFDYAVLTADLNGENRTVNGKTVDAVAFMTLQNESLITGSETRFHDAMELFSEAMHNLDDGEESDIITGNSAAADLAEAADDILSSLSTNTLVTLNSLQNFSYNEDIYDFPVQSFNAKAFFTNPPSASDVTSSDPFVYNSSDNTIEPVESYFRSLFNTIATF